MIHLIRKLGCTAAVALLVLSAGCTDAASPLTARAGEPAFNTGGGPDVAALARFKTKPQITIAWAKKWIGPEGGRLDFYGFAIEVPRGAVDKVTQFTIRLPVDPKGSDHVLAEFGPHAQPFNVPVSIELPYANSSIYGAADPTIVWWNNGWVDMGASVTPDGLRLRTSTDHFSEYGTTDNHRSGTLIVGGG